MTTLPPRRKRSVAAGLTAVGAVAMLSGCDDNNEQARFGPPTEVAAFQTIQECVNSGQYDRATCTTAQQKAFNEDEFGAAQCQRRSEGGQSFFTPLLTGFLIGQILNNNASRYTYGGLYRDRRDGGGWYTPGGAYLSPNNGYRYNVGSKAITTPVTTQRIQTRSSVVSRGGFGGRVSARSGGGWGGGRSFGG
jgi:uncharacterized protein YgiB involved in biofilm formation